MEYLKNGVLPGKRAEAIKVKARAARYSLMNRVLYRRSLSGPYLWCLPKGEAKQVMEQVYQGMCSKHIGGRILCHRIVTQAYY